MMTMTETGNADEQTGGGRQVNVKYSHSGRKVQRQLIRISSSEESWGRSLVSTVMEMNELSGRECRWKVGTV